jgi:hypothetical protein
MPSIGNAKRSRQPRVVTSAMISARRKGYV